MINARGRRGIPKVLIGFGRHLIYAEGTKTELLYAENLKKLVASKLNVDLRDVEIIPVPLKKSKHTLELVDFAVKDTAKRRLNNETIDHVWIFYDKDDFNDFDETYQKIQQLNTMPREHANSSPCDEYGTAWHACWSNECFEVWVYHYFENLETPLERSEYIKKINSFLKARGCSDKYSKSKKNLHSFLTDNGGSIKNAIKWMKKKDVTKGSKPNPSSGVYLFAEYIFKYIDNKRGK